MKPTLLGKAAFVAALAGGLVLTVTTALAQSDLGLEPAAPGVSSKFGLGDTVQSFYAEGPSGGPDWGLRFALTFLFPN